MNQTIYLGTNYLNGLLFSSRGILGGALLVGGGGNKTGLGASASASAAGSGARGSETGHSFVMWLGNEMVYMLVALNLISRR
jgi:hypothetical protein